MSIYMVFTIYVLCMVIDKVSTNIIVGTRRNILQYIFV